MSIWQYDAVTTDTESVRLAVGREYCLFCNTPLDLLKSEHSGAREVGGYTHYHRMVRVCPLCGWWIAKNTNSEKFGQMLSFAEYGAAAQLRVFDLTGTTEPIEEIRRYLIANYDARYQIHPKVFEETVASVFRSLGYVARVTAYSGDDGIDVVLDGPNDQAIGVQVKRYRSRIAVEAIRSLAGALFIGGLTRGIFVTTSSFQSGADRTARLAAMRGKPIELFDAERFYDAMKLAQRDMYTHDQDKSAPFTSDHIRYCYLGGERETRLSIAP